MLIFSKFFCPILKCSHNSLCESYFYYPPFRDENTKAQKLFSGCLLAFLQGHWSRNRKVWALGSGPGWLTHSRASKVWMGAKSQTLSNSKGVQHICIQAATPASPGEDTPFPLIDDPYRSVCSSWAGKAQALPIPLPVQRGIHPKAPRPWPPSSMAQ